MAAIFDKPVNGEYGARVDTKNMTRVDSMPKLDWKSEWTNWCNEHWNDGGGLDPDDVENLLHSELNRQKERFIDIVESRKWIHDDNCNYRYSNLNDCDCPTKEHNQGLDGIIQSLKEEKV